MADPTDLTLPLTPAKIRRAVEAIVEQVHPRPRAEMCIPVADMEQKLTALVGEAVQLAYNDAAAIRRDARERLARWLWIADGGDSNRWDQLDDNPHRRRFLALADQALNTINGKD